MARVFSSTVGAGHGFFKVTLMLQLVLVIQPICYMVFVCVAQGLSSQSFSDGATNDGHGA